MPYNSFAIEGFKIYLSFRGIYSSFYPFQKHAEKIQFPPKSKEVFPLILMRAGDCSVGPSMRPVFLSFLFLIQKLSYTDCLEGGKD